MLANDGRKIRRQAVASAVATLALILLGATTAFADGFSVKAVLATLVVGAVVIVGGAAGFAIVALAIPEWLRRRAPRH